MSSHVSERRLRLKFVHVGAISAVPMDVIVHMPSAY